MEQFLNFLISLDENIFLFFNGMHNNFWDNFMMLYTGKYIWVLMYTTIFFILYRSFKWKAATILTLALILSILLADQVCATYIRPYLERLRPSNLENPLSALTLIVDGYRGGRYGFPSCHAANSMALAMFLSLVIRRRGFVIFIFGWALLNSYTRLYLGVHYPGDLLVGGIIGTLIGLIMYLCASKLAELSASAPTKNIKFSLKGYHMVIPDSGIMSLTGIITTLLIITISIIQLFA